MKDETFVPFIAIPSLLFVLYLLMVKLPALEEWNSRVDLCINEHANAFLLSPKERQLREITTAGAMGHLTVRGMYDYVCRRDTK